MPLKPVGQPRATGEPYPYLKVMDRRADALYDRVQLKAGVWTPDRILCYAVPVGSIDPFLGPPNRRTFVDTNMVQSNILPAPHDMILGKFLFLFQPSCSEADRNAWLANYQWDFRLLEKTVQRQPVMVSAAVGRPEDVIEGWGKGSWLQDKGNAYESLSHIHKLGEGIAWDMTRGGKKGETLAKYLPPLTFFDVELLGNPFRPEADLDFYVMLHGSRDFAVQ